MNPERLLKRLKAIYTKENINIVIDVNYHFTINDVIVYTWSIYDFFPLEMDKPIPVSKIDDEVFGILSKILEEVVNAKV